MSDRAVTSRDAPRPLLDWQQLRELLGGRLSKSTIDRWEKEDGTFPERLNLGANSIRWYADEVARWVEERAGKRSQAPS